MTEPIHGGAFLLARQLFDSDFWLDKPASWKVIWIYILGKVNHRPHGQLGRGEGFFNFSDEKRNIGKDITDDKIKKFLQYGRRTQMLRTTRSTRGLILSVNNYSTYQHLLNYGSTTVGTGEAREKHDESTPIYNNDKNDKNVNNNPVEKKILKIDARRL